MPSKISQIQFNGVDYDIKDSEAVKLRSGGNQNEIVVLSNVNNEVVASGTSLSDIFSRIDVATIVDSVEDGEWTVNIINGDGSIDLSNYYTKSKVNELIGQITTITPRVVSSLPEVGEVNVLYIVPNNSSEQNDSHDEYLYIENNWELVGHTGVDLTGYATESWVTGKGYATTASLAPVATSGSYDDLTDKPLEIFPVYYGTTTFSEIDAASNAGKLCLITNSDNGRHHFLTNFIMVNNIEYAVFSAVETGGKITYTYCSQNNEWSIDYKYIPAEQVQSDWSVADNSSKAFIKNKPNLFSGNYNDLSNKPSLFSGSYTDLTNKPTIPTSGSIAENDTGYATGGAVYSALQNLSLTYTEIRSSTSGVTKYTGNEIFDMFEAGVPLMYNGEIIVLAKKIESDYCTFYYLHDGMGSNVTSNGLYVDRAKVPLTGTTVSDAGIVLKIPTSAQLSKLDNIFTGAVASGNTGYVLGGSVYTALADKADSSSLATVATTGAYSDLSGTPTLATVATSGDYDDILNKPSLFSGSYTDLTDKPSLFSGSYTDLTDKPTIPVAGSIADNNTGYVTGGDVYTALANKQDVLPDSSSSGGTAPSAGDVLVWDGTEWVAQTPAAGVQSDANGYYIEV
ncbi:MAG: hypothetical protein J6T96_05645 [Bacteroidales bacterium]|nr:hypothetical protein [Bacteroidales bacterium]